MTVVERGVFPVEVDGLGGEFVDEHHSQRILGAYKGRGANCYKEGDGSTFEAKATEESHFVCNPRVNE
jgi:hypothetical protein